MQWRECNYSIYIIVLFIIIIIIIIPISSIIINLFFPISSIIIDSLFSSTYYSFLFIIIVYLVTFSKSASVTKGSRILRCPHMTLFVLPVINVLFSFFIFE